MKIEAIKEEGYEITVKVDLPREKFAMVLLDIFNKVRDTQNLIRVQSADNNEISVVCTSDWLDSTKDWLDGFGDIVKVKKVLCLGISDNVDYDFDKYWDLVILV